MARNKSEQFPKILEQRVIETPCGERTLYLVGIHNRKGRCGSEGEWRVAIFEKKGTTWRRFSTLNDARARFKSIPSTFRLWETVFPGGAWKCNDLLLTDEGFNK